jgi:hypothetical protein
MYVQGDSGGKVNILVANTIGHNEKHVSMNLCTILNVTAMVMLESPDLTPLDFCLLGLVEE